MKQKIYRITLIQEYEHAQDWALFSQETVAAIRDCSLATLERDRWIGVGIPFIKMGRSMRYRKEWSMLTERKIVQKACDELVAAGWVRLELQAYQMGRPKLPMYVINPKLRINSVTEENIF